MLEVIQPDQDDDFDWRLILMPDRSLNWEQNKRFIWISGMVCGTIAVAFTLTLGAWVILPFAGLEILLLASALYYVSWKLSYRHILTIRNNNLILEKGVYRPRGRWEWPLKECFLSYQSPKHDWEAKQLYLHHESKDAMMTIKISLGEFLNPSDAETTIQVLKSRLLVRAVY